MVRILLPFMARVEPVCNVRLFEKELALICGMLMAPVGMITLVVAVGMPPHQLAARFQLLVLPSQNPIGFAVTLVETGLVGPPHPLAETDTVAAPLNPEPKLALPVVPEPEIEFPDPETDQL